MHDYKTQILNSIPENNCCSHAFLNTIFYSLAQIDEDKTTILVNANQQIIKKINKILTNFYPNIEINIWDNFLLITSNVHQILTDCNVEESFNINFFSDECDRLTILKTIFLVNGRLYFNKDENEKSKGYLLEFSVKDNESADNVVNLLQSFNFKLKKTNRLNYFVIYTKNSNTICDLLVKLGAGYTALEIQNNLAMREVRNTLNRQNNCFESNLDKTISKSVEQIEAINYIIKHHSIDYLSENLKEVALARICNPDVSLSQLKTLLNNTISRAGIKYRLDKIMEIYKNLKGENK